MHLPHCPALPGRATTWTESRAVGFEQSGAQPCSIWGKLSLQHMPALNEHPCWFQPFAFLLIGYYTSATMLSVTLKHHLLILNLLLLLSISWILHFLIDRTITSRDILQISPNHLPLTDFSSSFEVLQNLSISNCTWGFEWREAVVFQRILIFSLPFPSVRVTQGLLSFC